MQFYCAVLDNLGFYPIFVTRNAGNVVLRAIRSIKKQLIVMFEFQKRTNQVISFR